LARKVPTKEFKLNIW